MVTILGYAERAALHLEYELVVDVMVDPQTYLVDHPKREVRVHPDACNKFPTGELGWTNFPAKN